MIIRDPIQVYGKNLLTQEESECLNSVTSYLQANKT